MSDCRAVDATTGQFICFPLRLHARETNTHLCRSEHEEVFWCSGLAIIENSPIGVKDFFFLNPKLTCSVSCSWSFFIFFRIIIIILIIVTTINIIIIIIIIIYIIITIIITTINIIIIIIYIIIIIITIKISTSIILIIIIIVVAVMVVVFFIVVTFLK